MNDIRIGIIGAGEHIRRAHAPGLVHIEGVKISRWFDPGTKSEDISAEEKIGTKSTFEEVIADSEITTVLIGSPDRFHPDQFLAAIEAGKHVFIEKPLAIDSVGFEKVVKGLRLAKEKKLVVSSCHPRRFDPPVLALKDLFDNSEWVEGNIGKITRFDFRFIYHEVTDAWKHDRSLLLDHFGHEIDLLRYFLHKKGKDVLIEARKIRDGFAAYTAEGNIDDITFTFDGIRILDESKYQEYIQIEGSKGMVTLYLTSGALILNSKKGQEILKLPAKDYTDMFKVVNENFIAAIQGIEEPYLQYYDFLVNNYSGICLLEKGKFSTAENIESFKDLLL